jgi:hypothetical protein
MPAHLIELPDECAHFLHEFRLRRELVMPLAGIAAEIV